MTADDFFDLTHYAHKDLWKEGEPVWEALHQLKNYVDKFQKKIHIRVPEGVFLDRPELISIGKYTVIEPGVFIQGPCIIGDHCIIRHGAYIREYVIIGNGSAIGHSAELKHSILLNEAAATHFVYVGDSILGQGVNLGAGVKCANLRLDRKEVSVQGKRTGLRKFGALVGDGAQIGCNCVLNPGTLIGKKSICYPLLNISGYIPPHSCLKGEPNHV